MLVLIADKNQRLHLQSEWTKKPPKAGTAVTIRGEDMTVDEPGRVLCVLSDTTRDFMRANWTTNAIESMLEIADKCRKAKERKPTKRKSAR